MNAKKEFPATLATTWPMRFSIDGLDRLFDADRKKEWGYGSSNDPTVINITGPEGSGRSLLALHLISSYVFDLTQARLKTATKFPTVTYLSRDLRAARASTALEQFGLLKRPLQHPFNDRDEAECVREIGFSDYTLESENLLTVHKRKFSFIDFLTKPGGDDWAWIQRFVAMLPDRQGMQPKHLLVIDSVDSFMSVHPAMDTYGRPVRHESVIMELIRTAAKQSHLVFVSRDESISKSVLAEASHCIVGLTRDSRPPGNRQIEILKASGQSPVEGRHDYFIRSGQGSYTSDQPNPDDPPNNNDGQGTPKSYINICHSPSWRQKERENQRLETTQETSPESKRVFAFGLPYLDDLFPSANKGAAQDSSARGIREGRIAAVLGEPATYKSRLARCWLANAIKTNKDVGAVLISTQDLQNPTAGEVLRRHTLKRDVFATKDNFVYRRLPMLKISGAEFLHIVDSCVRRLKTKGNRSIVLVLDDLTVVGRICPELIEEPVLLDYFLYWLRWNKVTTLICESLPDESDRLRVAAERGMEYRDVEHRVFLWRQSFFGSDRVALQVVPCAGSTRSSIRELKPNGSPNEALVVDPHFDCYEIDIDRPNEIRRVRLELRLVTPKRGERKPSGYLREIRDLFQRIHGSEHFVFSLQQISQYELMRSAHERQSDVATNSTTVVQLDEFWKPLTGAPNHSDDARALLGLADFLESPGRADENHDLSPPPPSEPSPRWKQFTNRSGQLFHVSATEMEVNPGVDRLPYVWDFGFIYWDHDKWNQFGQGVKIKTSKGEEVDLLSLVAAPSQAKHNCSWRDFLSGCQQLSTIALRRGQKILGFDFDRLTGEAFLCLFLEIWFSEIESRHGTQSLDLVTRRRAVPAKGETRVPLSTLVEKFGYEFFLAIVLFFSVCDADRDLLTRDLGFRGRSWSIQSFAGRHWYSTAFLVDPSRRKSYSVAPLPGLYSTRGDWDLGITGTSRSRLLGERALEVLLSRRGNYTRLRRGVGLPTRVLSDSESSDSMAYTYLYDTLGRRGCRPLKYGEFLKRAGVSSAPANPMMWLCRSAIHEFAGASRVMQVIISSMLRTCTDLGSSEYFDCHDAENSIGIYDHWANQSDSNISANSKFAISWLVKCLKMVESQSVF